MPYWRPKPGDIDRLVAESRRASGDPQAQDNHLFALLFDRYSGLYRDHDTARAVWKDGERLIRRLRRREWIERYFRIRSENGLIVTLQLNAAQRRLECMILRMERTGIPVRIIILKARQEGISTYIQAFGFERGLRTKNFRGLIVAHNHDTAKILLQMAEVGRTEMLKRGGDAPEKWNFKMKSKARAQLEWADPIGAQIQITSAEAPNPGIGGTRTMLHLSEFAKYPDPEVKIAALLPSLPVLPGTYGFKESTAEGADGLFHDEFWEGWNERGTPLRERAFPWVSLFMAWWEHDTYRYSCSYGAGRQPDGKLFAQIRDTLDAEEQWLLRQSYFRRWKPDDEWEEVPVPNETLELKMRDGKIAGTIRRESNGRTKWRRVGVGMRKVDIDQLAWRRLKIKEMNGDITLFNREYPSRPEVAFVSSGRPVFDIAQIDERMRAGLPEPIFRGSLRSPQIRVYGENVHRVADEASGPARAE